MDTSVANDFMKDTEVEYIDFRFTDPRGKVHHVTMHRDAVDEDALAEGLMFDGSSIDGWKEINQSDTVMLPDLSTAFVDPFFCQKTIAVFCDILEPSTMQPYSRDPRSTAKRAEVHLAATGIGDYAYFGPEAEFFAFDSVRFDISPYRVAVELDGNESANNDWKDFEFGNQAHRPGLKGGYMPLPPLDSGHDMRGEMLSTLKNIGIEVEKHHHEVAPNQHELGIKFNTLIKSCDSMQIYKYVVHNVARAYGKTATFMPKPVYGDNGSGMHVNQSIYKGSTPVFSGNLYADLSEESLYYIGGILKHARALNAFTNPSTNSYKRLIPGYEAPVLLAYSANNRSAACRIPYTTSPKTKRVEMRFPDPTANVYLAFSAMLMAGLDGIQNKIHPGEAIDKDLYALPPEELEDIPTVCASLREALAALKDDHTFLLKGDVFSEDQIQAYIQLKMHEAAEYDSVPHPIEFKNYYSS
jgi:glutamine synthetase